MAKAVHKQTAGKSWVEWSIPNEVARVLFRPGWVHRRARYHGLGHEADIFEAPTFKSLLIAVLEKVAASRAAVMQWHLAKGCFIDKHNGKKGVDAERAIVVMCVLGRAFFEAVLSLCDGKHGRPPPEAPPAWKHGCIARRRWEAAMMIQMNMSWRLRQCGVHAISRFHDATNAFWSLKHDDLEERLAPPFTSDELAHELTTQRSRYAAVRVYEKAAEGHTDVLLGSGVMPGDHAGPKFFCKAYNEGVDIAMEKYRQGSKQAWRLWACSPLCPKSISMGRTGFVDDLGVKVTGGSLEELLEDEAMEQAVLKDQLGDMGVGLNQPKQVNVPEAPSQYSLRKLFSMRKCNGEVAIDARYLGGRHTHGLVLKHELDRRVKAVKMGWLTMNKFWTSAAPFKLKRLMAMALLQGNAISGLEACVGSAGKAITVVTLRRLDTCILKYLRVSLGTKARWRQKRDQGEEGYGSIPNEEVWAKCKIAPCLLELRIRKLKWYREVVAHQQEHQQTILAWLGDIACEPVDVDTLTAQGFLSSAANPWAKQFEADVLSLEALDSGQDLLLEVEAGGKINIIQLFREAADLFLGIDVAELRAQYFSVAVGPPGFGALTGGCQSQTSEKAEGTGFRCVETCADGSICSLAFVSFRQLMAHISQSRAGTHGRKSLEHVLTLTNECPICRSTFKNRHGANTHVTASRWRG